MASQAMYQVRFSAKGIADVVAFLGADAVTVASGYGGWEVLSRQRRVGLTVWNGKDPIRMAVPVLFDGVRAGDSQELPISRLSRMALPPTTGGEPPTVRVFGTGVPKPGPVLWVIENLQWGTNVIRDFANNGVHARLRQDCTVNLLEYRAEDLTAFKGLLPGKVTSKAPSSSGSKTGWPKQYIVKTGDTLAKIAAHFYNDAGKWGKIATANGIRDPQTISRYVGKSIRIPAP